jgi:hypothetical protein
MMPDNNPFLEGYVSHIRGTDCPYQDGTQEAERWCRGFGGKPVAKAEATPLKAGCHLSQTAEGRRPFVEGYKSAILAIRFGQNTVCPYDAGTSEHERWWKGFREPVIAKTSASRTKPAAIRKPLPTPVLEGRRPFVEGYKSQIMAIRFGKKSDCPYEEGTPEYARWTGGFTKGFRGGPKTFAAALRQI